MYAQTITPNPAIACRPGWCLEYVRKTFGLPVRYGSATEAWEASTTQHRDMAFPTGVAVPLWFGLESVPDGHVVLRMPDGSVYSTTDPTGTTPHHHPSLADLDAHYAEAGLPLIYRGWTEDVCGFPVITWDGIAAQGTTTTTTTHKDEEMIVELTAVQAESIAARAAELTFDRLDNKVRINAIQAESIVAATTSRTVAKVDEKNTGKLIDRGQADDIARAAARYSDELEAN
jgi:hypothetical protein